MHPNRSKHQNRQGKSRWFDQLLKIKTGQQGKGKQDLAGTYCPKRPFRQTINAKFLLQVFRATTTKGSGTTKTKEPNPKQGQRDQCLKYLGRPFDHTDKADKKLLIVQPATPAIARHSRARSRIGNRIRPIRTGRSKNRKHFFQLMRTTGRTFSLSFPLR
jgi:hypothetical protein